MFHTAAHAEEKGKVTGRCWAVGVSPVGVSPVGMSPSGRVPSGTASQLQTWKAALRISTTKARDWTCHSTGTTQRRDLCSLSWMILKSLNKQNWLNKVKGLNPGLLSG